MKQFVKGKRNYARVVANLDGRYHGVSQNDAERAFDYMIALDVACRLAGYQSPLHMLKSKSIKKVKALKKK